MTTSQLEQVTRYYSAQAPTYAEGSKRGLWRWFRSMETRAVLSLARPKAGEAILDAGSGAGHYTEVLVRAGARVTALDAAPAMLAALRERLNVQTIEADLMTVRLEPAFDKVVCLGVLEFVPDVRVALANLAAALRPEGPGEITILVPSRSVGGRCYQTFHRRHGVAVQLFSRDDLQRVAAGIGMRLDATVGVTFNIVARLRREPGSGNPQLRSH